MSTTTTKTPKSTPEELLREALEKSLRGCDYPEEVQEWASHLINEWVNSFTELCRCYRPERYCNCP